MTDEQYEAKIKDLEDRLAATTEQAANLYRMIYSMVVHCGPEIRIKKVALNLPHVGVVAMREDGDDVVIYFRPAEGKEVLDGPVSA